ncbi:MAG: peptidylprolyl isomerase [Gammaproteobacteria bacterium]|jgi:FKBP-type peptidyl-prolyl cis-trans isomerase SlyD
MKPGNALIFNKVAQAVRQDKVVRLRFRVRDAASGELLQYGDDLFYLHGGYGGAFPKVERAMFGRRVGDAASVTLSPEEGYGHHDPSLVVVVPAREFEDGLPRAGESVEGRLHDGRLRIFMVTAASDRQVILDGNHPFAGRSLAFDFEVLAIRDSLAAERRAGFAFDGAFGERAVPD